MSLLEYMIIIIVSVITAHFTAREQLQLEKKQKENEIEDKYYD